MFCTTVILFTTEADVGDNESYGQTALWGVHDNETVTDVT